MTTKVLLTIDVEDWFQVENLRSQFPPISWDKFPLRVEGNTHRLLDLFDRERPGDVSATFFVLGWVAERLPDLVREIHCRGHEVASHGYGHMMCGQLGLEELEKDLVRSKQLLEDITGHEVQGYRAPNFSVNDQALALIQNAGYRYDSSYNDFSRHGRYGLITTSGKITHGIAVQLAEGFYELPISNLRLLRQTLPWGGGGYFRFMPFALFKTGIRKILAKSDAYMFYMHPWEIDPGQPRAEASKGMSGWRHYLNLDKTHSRLARLISTFKHCDFITCSRYLKEKSNGDRSPHL